MPTTEPQSESAVSNVSCHVLTGSDTILLTPGAEAGALRVAEASPHRLELRARPVPAILLAIAGLLGLGFLVVLGADIANKMFRSESVVIHPWFMILVFAVAVSAIWTAVSRLGLSYTFDAHDRVVRVKRRFGAATVWRADDVDHMRLTVQPAAQDGWAGRERLTAKLFGPDGKELTPDPLFGNCRTGTAAGLGSARAAIAAARLIGVPVHVYGVVEKGTDELAALLTGRSR